MFRYPWEMYSVAKARQHLYNPQKNEQEMPKGQQLGGFKTCTFRLLERHSEFSKFILKILSDLKVYVYAQSMILINLTKKKTLKMHGKDIFNQ